MFKFIGKLLITRENYLNSTLLQTFLEIKIISKITIKIFFLLKVDASVENFAVFKFS